MGMPLAFFFPSSGPVYLSTDGSILLSDKGHGEGGEVLFETNCEIPSTWSHEAANMVANKYLYGEVGTPEREPGVRQLVHRVCRTIADWGHADGYFATAAGAEDFYRDLTWLCIHQHAAFDSPVWTNVGLFQQHGIKEPMGNWRWDPEKVDAVRPANPYECPQGSSCFIQSIDDNVKGIMETAQIEAMLFKFSSTAGIDLSSLRSHRETLCGGGELSQPPSFMRACDRIAAMFKSRGKTPQAAKMLSIKDWHPDVMEFITCKHDAEKNAHALIAEGYDSEEVNNAFLFRNANLSIRLSDEFMRAAETDWPWTTQWVTDPKREGPTYSARDLFRTIAENAWLCGAPGVQYDTTINRWHTCKASGRINASSPGSEYMFLDNTACNLATINLMKFRQKDGTFDVERFQAACRIVFIAQDILIDHTSYPTAAIARNSHLYRPVGLGYSNLGALIMASGLPYDSDAARGLCGLVTALLHGAVNLTSTELAAAVGPFAEYDRNRDSMLDVAGMHWEQVEQIAECPPDLKEAARAVWDRVLMHGRRHGFRNAQATALPPAGSVSCMMGCWSRGIEPDTSLVKHKRLAGGGVLKVVTPSVPLALETLGYNMERIEAILKHIAYWDTIEDAPDLDRMHLPVFDCAFPPADGGRSIPWRAHIRMAAAAQRFISGAISKTVTMPNETTPHDVADAYMEAWRLGLKALAIDRDGSKQMQPLSTKEKAAEANRRPSPPQRH